jgi:hypothetical protein
MKVQIKKEDDKNEPVISCWLKETSEGVRLCAEDGDEDVCLLTLTKEGVVLLHQYSALRGLQMAEEGYVVVERD